MHEALAINKHLMLYNITLSHEWGGISVPETVQRLISSTGSLLKVAIIRFSGKADIDSFTELRWITIATQPGHFPI